MAAQHISMFVKQNEQSMKCYRSNSILKFGKYNGSSLQEIWAKSPSYIEWSLINLDHFTITHETYTFLQGIKYYTLKPEAIGKLFIEDECKPINDYHEGGTYEEYAGSYAQDVEGYSDEDIENIFDGDLEMYWNID